MRSTNSAANTSSVRPFRFESFGVKVEINSNEQDIIVQAEEVSRRSLLNKVTEIKNGAVDHHFELTRTKGGTYRLIQNDERLASGRSRRKFFKFFDSIIRAAVAEYAVDRVFLHAGVVGWKGKAIVIPGDSFKGKSTLVAELVRNGAAYYSDEYAVFDENGLVHPFHRPLAMRTDDGKYRAYELTVDELGGTYGKGPIPVGMVLLTEYAPNNRWSPKFLSSGQGVLEMIPFTFSIRQRPDFAFQVLNNVARRAIITSSRRGTAEDFAKTLLNFVDKHVD